MKRWLFHPVGEDTTLHVALAPFASDAAGSKGSFISTISLLDVYVCIHNSLVNSVYMVLGFFSVYLYAHLLLNEEGLGKQTRPSINLSPFASTYHYSKFN